MTEPDPRPVRTLGERLDAEGRHLATRFTPAFGWLGPLAVVSARAVALGADHDARFARTEIDPDARRRPRLPEPPGDPLPGLLAGPVSDHDGGHDRDGAPDRTHDRAHGRTHDAAPGRPLEPTVRSRLRDVVGEGAMAVRVHDDAPADALARAHGADAVTHGADVSFREGRFRPHEPRGFALLAHEADHVRTLLDPGAAWRRATRGGRDEEEAAAGALERALIHPGDAPGHRPAPVAAPPVTEPAPGPAAIPMTAAVDRDTSPGAPAAGSWDMAALRRELTAGVLADLRRQLRAESERGA